SLLARASSNFAGSSHPCEFTFTLHKFADPAGSCFWRPCRVFSPVRVYFHVSQVRQACWLVLLATLPGLLTRANLLSCFASSPSLLARASFDLAGSTRPSPSLLGRASCDLARYAHPCAFTFMLRKFAKPTGRCFLRPCRVCSPVPVYFHASQVRRVCSLVLLSTLPGLLARTSLLSCYASSQSLLARASCDLAGSDHPCEFTFMFPKFSEPPRSCFLRPCPICTPVRVYFHASQVRQAYWQVLLATLPSLLTRASLLSCFASSPSLLVRSSFKLAGSTRPCEFTFRLHKFAEPAGPCFWRPCRVCTPVRVYFHVSQVRRACWLVLLATLPGLLTSASLLSCFARSPRLLARASCHLAGSAHPCEFTFMHRKFAEPPRSCFLRHCRVCSLVRIYFHASQVRRVCSLVLLSTLPGQLARASLISYYTSSQSLQARASGALVGSAPPSEFSFMFRKFAELAGSCFLRPCLVCLPVLVYFNASQVRRVCSFVLLSTLPGQLARASLLSCYTSSQSLLARASGDLVGSAPPCEFTFMFRKFAELAGSCFLRPCRVNSPVRVHFHASQVRRTSWLVLVATLPSLLARASCELASSAHLCEFTFMHRKFAEPARSCFLRPCPICTPVPVYFHASQVRRACWLVVLATLPGLLTRFASSPSLLARASCDLAGSTRPYEFTFMLRKFAEPAGSCLLRPCRACSLVLLANLPVLLTCASSLSCIESSLSLLDRASCDLARYAHPCQFTFMLRKFVEPAGSWLRKFAKPAGSCFLRPCRVNSPVRVHFHASQVRRTSWLVLVATLPSLLARASCELASSAHLCEFTFMHRKFAEPARSCFLRPCPICTPVPVYFHASQVRRACWLVVLATLPGLLTRFASSPSLLARASCDLAGSTRPYEFTFMLRKFAEPAGSCLLRPCRACSLVLLANLPVLLTCASSLSCIESSLSLLDRASCDLARYAHPCQFTFMLRKFVEPAGSWLRKFAKPAGSCFLRPCRVNSPVRVHFHASQVRRTSWLVLVATLPSLLARASCELASSAHLCEFTFMHRKFAEPARSCFLRPCPICTPVPVYFHASQVRRACWLVVLATLPGLLTRFASSPSLLARASCDLAGSAHPYEFTFMLHKFAEPARSCFLRACLICTPVRVYFQASQVRQACWLVLLATLPGQLARTSSLSCFASSPNQLARACCELAEHARSCFLRTCQFCSPVRVHFHASKVR
ncbi:hypothetical protein CRG98_045831, partial [Punica granatum]